MRARIYQLLDGGRPGWFGRSISHALMLLIVINLVAVALETVPQLEAEYAVSFAAIEYVSLVVFTVEYAMRLWSCVEHPLFRESPAWARLRYVFSPDGLFDLMAVAPFWLALALPNEWRVLLVFRVVRIMKLGRYSPAMRSLLDCVYNERRALFGCFVILLGAALLSATAMYLLERGVQPERFGSIPEAMWWAIVTLGTIGYGDVVPVTAAGRVVATLTIFTGLLLVSLPIGIIATAFANDVHRRDFIVTWAMVARVPLFTELNAAQIAEVMRLLRSHQFDAGAVITRRGEKAHSMYFINTGQVELDVDDKRIRLGPGHFFGERAIFRNTRRTADVKALTRTGLLVLDGNDLRLLMEREPAIADRIREMVRARMAPAGEAGDILAEELKAEDAPSADELADASRS
jgi:voltage-gated potassium channel